MADYRKNTAGQSVSFVLIKVADGTALTGATVTARRTIDGGAQVGAGGTVSEVGNGQYSFALAQADTNGNNIGLLFTATGAIPVNIALVTTAADPTDGARFGLTSLPATTPGSSNGILIAGANVGATSFSAGLTITGPSNSAGLTLNGSGSGPGLSVNGGVSGSGAVVNAGVVGGPAILVNSTTGDALSLATAGGYGLRISGSGNNSGLHINGGPSGHAVELVGGSTSGSSLRLSTTNSDAVSTSTGTGNPTFPADVQSALRTALGSNVPANLNQFLNVSPTTSVTVNAVGGGVDYSSTLNSIASTINTNLDAKISSRAAQSTADDIKTVIQAGGGV